MKVKVKWTLVQALRLCTGTEALYRNWGSVQALRLCKALRLCTGTKALYRHWGSVQALRLCAGRTAYRGSRGIALPFLDHGTGRGWGVSVTPRPPFTPRKDPVSIVQEAGWAPGPVWTGAENLAPSPGFDPRTVQPVASRYTDYATRPTESTISTGERPQTYALDHAATGTGLLKAVNAKFLPLASYRKLAGRPRHWAVSDRFSCNSAFEAPSLLHTAHALALQTLHIVHTPSSCVAFDCHNKQRYFTSVALTL